MTFAVAATLIGVAIMYAGWKDLSVWAILRGDNTVTKAAGKSGGNSTSTKNG